ncbi:MAG: hypothetical protein VR64_13025 [Desulfatitalea sp. BRH_c12]|nr:MAG: hypothetical protein VR64_13025 [Desulfatitalea sp. BRH_c12]
MNYIYACKNKTCAEKEGAVFRVEFPQECILDEKNIATLFCNKCGDIMIFESKGPSNKHDNVQSVPCPEKWND